MSHLGGDRDSKDGYNKVTLAIENEADQTATQSKLEKLGRIARIGACAIALVAVPSLMKVGTAIASEEITAMASSSVLYVKLDS